MPEGHLYHHFARLQQEIVGVGAIEVTSPQGRFAPEAGQLDGRGVSDVTARGKNLFHHFDASEPAIVHVHLGMQGLFLHGDGTAPPKKQVRLRLARPGRTNWDLIAPTTCALMTNDDRQRIVDGLGPDPLDPAADVERAVRNVREARTTVGAALLDQKILSGVGNVFRAEALFEARLHPTVPTADLTDEEVHHIWHVLVDLMTAGEAAGEIAPKRIYKQDTCARCGTAVTAFANAGRTAYACPRCQPVERVAA